MLTSARVLATHAFLVLLLAGVFVWLNLAYFTPYPFGEAPTGIDPAVYVRPLIISVATIGGVLFRTLYDELNQSTDHRVKIFQILRWSLSSRAFWVAITISPVIIATFYSSLEQIQGSSLIALVSYQNGFFFRSVLEGVEARKRNVTRVDS